jgi:hypothetical protein
MAGRDIDWATDPTGHARRSVGAWPTPESLAERLIAALDSAADDEQEPEKKSKLKQASRAIGGVGRDVLVEVVAKVITQGV